MSDTFKTNNPELESLFERYRSAPDSYVFAPLADACRKAGMIEEAIEICEKGVSANPTYASGYVVRGKCYYDLGNADQAEASFEKVLELDPNNLVALKFMGLILAERGLSKEARGRFEHILALDPGDHEISTRLAELPEADAEAGDELREGLEEVLGEDEPPDADSDAAAEAVELREVKDEDFEGVQITLGDGGATPDVLATTTLADIYAAQGYRRKAVKIYRELLESQPGNSTIIGKLRDLGEPVDEPEPEPEVPAGLADPPPQPEPAVASSPVVADEGANDTVDETPDEGSPPPETPAEDAASKQSPVDANATHFKRWLQNLNR